MHRDLGATAADRTTSRPGTGASLPAAFRAERQVWGLSAQQAYALMVAPVLIMAAGTAMAVVTPTLFFALTEEDAVVEWLQVATLVVTVVAGALLTARLRTSTHRVLTLMVGVATVMVFFVAAEEISWGQRIFGLTTPEALGAINIQNETNLHNIANLELLVRFGQIAVAGLGATIPFVVLALRRFVPPLDRLLVPPLAMSLWFAPLAIYWLVRLPITPDLMTTRFSELPELVFYAGLAGVAVLNLFRVRRRATKVDPRRSPA